MHPRKSNRAFHKYSKPKMGFTIDSLVGLSPESPRSPSRSPNTSPSPIERKASPMIPEPIHLASTPSSWNSYLLQSSLSSAFPLPLQGIPPFPSVLSAAQIPNFPPTLPPAGIQKELPYFPWLMDRNRFIPHSLSDIPLSRFADSYMFQRKQKRIRTAFNSNQLEKLEQAFDKNRYVVGIERKKLAESLSLSEQQVKVWFQNRRTKHKKCTNEDDLEPSSSTYSSNLEQESSSSHSVLPQHNLDPDSPYDSPVSSSHDVRA